MSSQPRIVTMLGTNRFVGNQGGNSCPKMGNTTSGTSTSMVTPTPLLPFMIGLNLLDFNQLINDPLLHYQNWLVMSAKIPSYIPKFKGNPREYPKNHVHSYHMWCSSNSIIKHSIHVCLFERTLTGVAIKWYVN